MMAPELAPKVRVNAIEVGGVETDALGVGARPTTAIRRQLEDNTPMRRVGQVEDIAAVRGLPGVAGVVVGDRQGLRDRRRRRAPAFTIPFETL